MRRSLLVVFASLSLGACADLGDFDFEAALVLDDSCGVEDVATLPSLKPPAVLAALGPETVVVATDLPDARADPTLPAAAPVQAGRLGQRPGLYGDALRRQVTVAGPARAALPILQAIGGKAGIHVFASTRMAQSPAATLVVDLPSTTMAADALIRHVCVEAGVFCYYAGELAALSVYVPAEYRPAHAVVAAADTGLAGAE